MAPPGWARPTTHSLAHVADRVRCEKDYSVRAHYDGNNTHEFEALTSAFDEMLAGLHARPALQEKLYLTLPSHQRCEADGTRPLKSTPAARGTPSC